MLQLAFEPIDRCAVSNVSYSIIFYLELKMPCQSCLNMIWERAVYLRVVDLVCLT